MKEATGKTTHHIFTAFASIVLAGATLAGAAIAGERIRLATTTSAENSGLLDVLLPPFEDSHNVVVDVITVGSGKALTLARNGDVDLVLVHDPEAEKVFIRDGHGVGAKRVMYNYFVLLGPGEDPAGIGASENIFAALAALAHAKAPFVSRGDMSGTHAKERRLWDKAEIEPEGPWYIETGQGMAASIRIADEKRAYILADSATAAWYASKVELDVIFSNKDKHLLNPYTAIAANPANHPHVKHDRAMQLIDWLISPAGQAIIKNHWTGGKRLFVPGAETTK